MSIPRMSFSKGIGFFTGTVAAMLFETKQKLIINADLFCVLIYCTRKVLLFGPIPIDGAVCQTGLNF